MSIFEQALKKTLNDETSYTENGAAAYATSGHKLLDINFAASKLRSMADDEVKKMFSDAYQENPLLAVKWMFMLRDVRGGIGERKAFRTCFDWLVDFHANTAECLLKLIPEYGRWDDLIALVNSKLGEVVINMIDSQISEDFENLQEGKPISLLAKWMPSENTSSAKTRALATKIRQEINLTSKDYRKLLSKLRAYLKVVEVSASAKKWSEIDYEKVPSLANIKYKDAFLRNDNQRRVEFLQSLQKGEAKINSTTCFPSDIVHTYTSGYGVRDDEDAALEAMWKSLPNYMVEGNVIAVVDGSGSMYTPVSGSMTALQVANALGLYCAEHLTGPFKNKFITFSSRPQYVDVSKATTLREKLSIAYSHDECANTNLEATFDLLLKTATQNNLKQEDIPTLVFLSDMQFDCGSSVGYCGGEEKLLNSISKKWEAAGYKLPRCIWWNIAGRSNTIPMQQNAFGCVLCSGYSQSQFKMIASNKADPYEVLVEALNAERYAPVEAAIKDVI